MGIIHLDCGTLRPVSQRLMNGHGSLLRPGRLACRVLLVPGAEGWTMIDAGLGTADLADPVARLGRRFLRAARPVLDPQQTALAQVRALEIDPESVTRIVLTHHDLDHVGGIADFPWARVHLSVRQLDLVSRDDASGVRRPLPDGAVPRRLHPAQWSHGPHWVPERLTGTYAGRPCARITEDITLVALDGHITGHCGVVIHRPGAPDLVHAGDALFSTGTLHGAAAPLGLAVVERMMRTEPAAWRSSRDWLRHRHRDGAEVICSHQPW